MKAMGCWYIRTKHQGGRGTANPEKINPVWQQLSEQAGISREVGVLFFHGSYVSFCFIKTCNLWLYIMSRIF